MLVRHLANLFINPINISLRHLSNLFLNPINISLRLLGKLLLIPSNIPRRRFAFATRRCPPSKGEFFVFNETWPAARRRARTTGR